MIKETALFIAISGLCLGAGLLHASDRHDNASQQERLRWVQKCLNDFESIKQRKITRAEVENIFVKDGGLQSFATVRYCHSECSHFKIDVTFDVTRNPSDPKPDDRVVSVSKPYIEEPYYD